MKFKTLQVGLFISLLVVATILFGWLISGYSMPIFWAIVLAILFYPIYQKIYKKVGNRGSTASLLTILFILTVVLVPLYFVGLLVTKEAFVLYTSIVQQNPSMFAVFSHIETLLSPLQSLGVDTSNLQAQLIAFAQNASVQIGSYAFSIGKATVDTIIATLLMLYVLFFVLRDGETIGTRLLQAIPLGDEKEKLLFSRFTSLVRALFKGNFIVAFVQGFIGTILFFVVGIKAAILWGVVMGVFALIPAIGPAIIWLPAGVLLLLGGDTWQGIVVLGVGVSIISLIDNVLRPLLVARGTAMSDVLILLSIFGGLSLFGIAGIIIGPVITAFFLSMWQLFEHDYEKELKKFG